MLDYYWIFKICNSLGIIFFWNLYAMVVLVLGQNFENSYELVLVYLGFKDYT